MKKILIFIVIAIVLSLLTAFCLRGGKTMKVNVDDGIIYGELINCSKDVIVLIIAGSGPTDMNGNTPLMPGNNDCFLQLAKALEKEGISTFRYDKRTAGQSAESFESLSENYFDAFVEDLNDCIQQLKNMGYKKIVLAGHSQGSLVGMLAAENADGYISIAGSGYSIDETMIRQYSADEDMFAEEIRTIKMLQENIINESIANDNQMFSIDNQKFLLSWMKYDPSEEISKLTLPVLLIQGDADLQVLAEDAEELHKAYPNAQVIFIEDMNHVLKKVYDIDENVRAYQDPSFAIHAQLVGAISSFAWEVVESE